MTFDTTLGSPNYTSGDAFTLVVPEPSP